MLAVIIEVFQVEKGLSVTFQKKPFSALGRVEEGGKREGGCTDANKKSKAGRQWVSGTDWAELWRRSGRVCE